MKSPKALIQYLKRHGHSQTEMAKIAGVSQMTISRWSRSETGRVNIFGYNKLLKLYEKEKGEK